MEVIISSYMILPSVCSNLYNNTPTNAIVNVASNISYRPLIQADVTCRCFVVPFMNEIKNLTNVVIGK